MSSPESGQPPQRRVWKRQGVTSSLRYGHTLSRSRMRGMYVPARTRYFRHTPPEGERQRPPCSASRRCMECVHSATAEPTPIEETARNQFLQRVLHHRPVEAKPDGASNLIGGRAVRLLRRERGQDLRRCGRRTGRRHRVRVLGQRNDLPFAGAVGRHGLSLPSRYTPYPLLSTSRPSGGSLPRCGDVYWP